MRWSSASSAPRSAPTFLSGDELTVAAGPGSRAQPALWSPFSRCYFQRWASAGAFTCEQRKAVTARTRTRSRMPHPVRGKFRALGKRLDRTARPVGLGTAPAQRLVAVVLAVTTSLGLFLGPAAQAEGQSSTPASSSTVKVWFLEGEQLAAATRPGSTPRTPSRRSSRGRRRPSTSSAIGRMSRPAPRFGGNGGQRRGHGRREPQLRPR